MPLPRQRYIVGSHVRIASLENESYAKFHGKVLRVAHVATRYMKAKDFFSQGQPDGYHPGFDSAAGSALYDVEELDGTKVPFSLYDWELMT